MSYEYEEYVPVLHKLLQNQGVLNFIKNYFVSPYNPELKPKEFFIHANNEKLQVLAYTNSSAIAIYVHSKGGVITHSLYIYKEKQYNPSFYISTEDKKNTNLIYYKSTNSFISVDNESTSCAEHIEINDQTPQEIMFNLRLRTDNNMHSTEEEFLLDTLISRDIISTLYRDSL